MKDRRPRCLKSDGKTVRGTVGYEIRFRLPCFAVCALVLLTAAGCSDTHSDEYREFSELEDVSEGDVSAAVPTAADADLPGPGTTLNDQTAVASSPEPAPSELRGPVESADRNTELPEDPNRSDPAAAAGGAAAGASGEQDADAVHPVPQPSAAADEDMDASGETAQTLSTPTVASETAAEPSDAAGGGIRLLVPHRQFRKEGAALRVSFDDLDLLKILNMDPVPRDAADHFPEWLRELHGKQVRIRGYMRPGFEMEDITEFLFVRDNGECCYGPLPKIYDMIAVQLADGESTDLIEGTPFDVEGIFRIEPHADEVALYALFFIDQAVIIE